MVQCHDIHTLVYIQEHEHTKTLHKRANEEDVGFGEGPVIKVSQHSITGRRRLI